MDIRLKFSISNCTFEIYHIKSLISSFFLKVFWRNIVYLRKIVVIGVADGVIVDINMVVADGAVSIIGIAEGVALSVYLLVADGAVSIIGIAEGITLSVYLLVADGAVSVIGIAEGMALSVYSLTADGALSILRVADGMALGIDIVAKLVSALAIARIAKRIAADGGLCGTDAESA